MFELKAERYKQLLYQTINQSELPVSLAYYILKDILRELENVYQENITQQIKDEEQGVNTETHEMKIPLITEKIEEEEENETN